eukprot:1525851-Amphidinium_carterae.5
MSTVHLKVPPTCRLDSLTEWSRREGACKFGPCLQLNPVAQECIWKNSDAHRFRIEWLDSLPQGPRLSLPVFLNAARRGARLTWPTLTRKSLVARCRISGQHVTRNRWHK